MKKLIATLAGVILLGGSMVMAETKFTPLNFDESNAITPATTTVNTAKATVDNKGNVMLDPAQVTGGRKMQNAILDLDNAQIEVRNKLINYRTNYTNIDQKYKVTKEERRAAKKKIRQAEKQIKNMENAKKKIRKNFEQKNNL